MLTFEWNALRAGDHVMVHDDNDPNLTLHEGVVWIVQTRAGAPNDVTMRVDGTLWRARRDAVHLLPLDRRGCWRCRAAGAGAVGTAA